MDREQMIAYQGRMKRIWDEEAAINEAGMRVKKGIEQGIEKGIKKVEKMVRRKAKICGTVKLRLLCTGKTYRQNQLFN